VQVPPQVQPGQEVRALVGEAAVLFVGRLLLVRGPLARVLDGQGGHDHQDLAGAVAPARLQQHAAKAGVGRDLGEAPPQRGQPAVLERPQLDQQVDPGLDAAPVRGVDEREGGHIAQPQRRHLEDHRGQVGAQDLGVGELRAAGEVLL
jgi:hypothetical protein